MADAQATGTQAVVRNISDTARWAAVFRARETERPDALFRDPFAERLAGQMGVDIANSALDRRANKILVLTEGLMIYLDTEAVITLAKDLALGSHFQRWMMDLSSPGLLRMMQRTTGKQLSKVGASFQFAPAEGPAFFAPHGWEPLDVESLLKTATRFKRPPFFLRLLSRLPETKGPAGNRPWSGVCLFKKR